MFCSGRSRFPQAFACFFRSHPDIVSPATRTNERRCQAVHGSRLHLPVFLQPSRPRNPITARATVPRPARWYGSNRNLRRDSPRPFPAVQTSRHEDGVGSHSARRFMLLSAFAGPSTTPSRRRITRHEDGHLPTPVRPQQCPAGAGLSATILTMMLFRRKDGRTSFRMAGMPRSTAFAASRCLRYMLCVPALC